MFNKEINQKFLTIEKKEFSFGSQKLINKLKYNKWNYEIKRLSRGNL